MPIADVNGISLNYRLEGDGDETIVLVNVLADDLETWMFQMDALLTAGYRVLRFDNRGVGASSMPPGPYATSLFAQATKAPLAQLESIRTHDTTARLGAIVVPTLVLAGEEDFLVPVRLSERLRDGIAGSTWRTTRGGHACLWEFPDDFNQALLEFLAAHRADG